MPEKELQPLQVVEALGGILLWGLLVWDHFQPDGPRDFAYAIRDNIRSLREYHRAMKQTLEDIEDLPEATDATRNTDNEEVTE